MTPITSIGTNAKVFSYLLWPENRHENGQQQTTFKSLEILVAQEPGPQSPALGPMQRSSHTFCGQRTGMRMASNKLPSNSLRSWLLCCCFCSHIFIHANEEANELGLEDSIINNNISRLLDQGTSTGVFPTSSNVPSLGSGHTSQSKIAWARPGGYEHRSHKSGQDSLGQARGVRAQKCSPHLVMCLALAYWPQARRAGGNSLQNATWICGILNVVASVWWVPVFLSSMSSFMQTRKLMSWDWKTASSMMVLGISIAGPRVQAQPWLRPQAMAKLAGPGQWASRLPVKIEIIE
ncbi:hypothetical protein L210DRAFT_3507519 [Boletus edulis BED1]|uniref:Uncharacterized protein n=1 Tax=Boletus edulis BED1 TaxID=1328754 RepID=A0AAD4GA47_BOLED|nr:hypothetical protein L210DRAFT_3507519 [Boletus edulis BED1]